MPRRLVCLLLAVAALCAGCGGGGDNTGAEPRSLPAVGPRPTTTASPQEEPSDDVAAQGTVTKNTSRLAGTNPAEDAAAVALATFPSRAPDLRPRAVAVADADDWHAAISAGALMHRPLRAPLLLSTGGKLSGASADALQTLSPTGFAAVRKATVLAVGEEAAAPAGQEVVRAGGASPAATGAATDDVLARAAGGRSREVIVAGADADAAPFSMPAAGLAAKTGAPVLWTGKDDLPDATRTAIRKRRNARIYVVGPPGAVGEPVVRALRRLGDVKRIGAEDAVENAVAVARYADGAFGWNVVDPGHGLVFAAANRPADAGAAAPLSASGSYGPLLLVDKPDELPRAVEEFLLDIQPGYDRDPVRGVYNHGWIIGGEDALTSAVQARVDGLLEIQPVSG